MGDVTLEHVGKTYGKNAVVVTDFNLEIQDREFMVFVGPSGCGKSTTLRMIAGLEEITEGTIRIDGDVVNDVDPKNRNIAMVFQNYALYPHMSVYDNMAFGLKLRHLPAEEIRKRVEDAASILGLADYLKRKPKELSGGQRQRVAVGRAIVRNPKVFLFDEPLSNLDAKMRVQMRAEIMRLHQRLNTTMIYVTHDQLEAMTMGDRICVMREGKVQQVDTPAAIYNHPANLFVAGFMGTPPMNFLSGHLVKDDGKLVFIGDGQPAGRLTVIGNQNLEAYLNRKVTLGFRPEDVAFAETAEQGDCLQGTVELVELMGADSFVHVTLPGGNVIVRTKPELQPQVGAKVRLAPCKEKIHFFDGATEGRIG